MMRFAPPSRKPESDAARTQRPVTTPAQLESGRIHRSLSCTVRQLGIRTKLAVSEPGDQAELEADRIADRIVRMAAPSAPFPAPSPGPTPPIVISRFPLDASRSTLQRETSSPFSRDEGLETTDEDQAQSSEQEKIQTKRAWGEPPRVDRDFETEMGAIRGGGHPLPTSVRAFMEPRFDHDFSRVRIHADARADRLAASVEARAFTLGSDVVFRGGEYAPETDSGRRLLAHELTHVVQQSSADSSSAPPFASDAATEGGARTPTPVPRKIQRVKWHPNRPTGKRSYPWGSGPVGPVLEGATDAGTPLDIWRPDDGVTYWCHGYTFGGSTAKAGPYSIWGQDVPTVLRDDGWKQNYACIAQPGDILIFYDDAKRVLHSGIVRSPVSNGGIIDENASTLQSKWGQQPLNTSSWQTNIKQYGSYRLFTRGGAQGPCKQPGAHELP